MQDSPEKCWTRSKIIGVFSVCVPATTTSHIRLHSQCVVSMMDVNFNLDCCQCSEFKTLFRISIYSNMSNLLSWQETPYYQSDVHTLIFAITLEFTYSKVVVNQSRILDTGDLPSRWSKFLDKSQFAVWQQKGR